MRVHMKKLVTFLNFTIVLCIYLSTVGGAEAETVESTSGILSKIEATFETSPDDVLARVNGSAITRAEVDRVIRIFIAQSRVSHDISTEARIQAENASLEQIIATRLLFQAGLKLEIKDLDKQIVDRINQEKTKFPTPGAYDAILTTNNFTEQDAKQIIHTEIVVTNLVNKEIISKIAVSGAEAKVFYDQNQEKFTTSENIRLSQILIGVELQATTEEKLKARGKAESLRSKILAGSDFTAIAATESTCPSKEQGGDLGYFEKEDMIQEFEKATEALKIGEISPVVETRDGFHILKLVEKNNSAVLSFDETKEKIEYFIKQIKTRQAIKDYVADLRKTAKVDFTTTTRPGSSTP